MRKTLLVVVVALIGIGAFAVWPAQAQPAPGSLAALEGRWERRDFRLTIDGTGFGRARWRMGVCLEDLSSRPCDRMIDGALFQGGAAEIVFTRLAGDMPFRAEGIVATTTSDVFLYGPISLVQVTDDLAMLEQFGRSVLWLCKPPRDPNACGP